MDHEIFRITDLIYESDGIMCTKKDLNWNIRRISRFKCIRTKKELIAYVQWNKCDWVNLATGPTRFWYMNRNSYDKCLEIINRGKIAIYSKTYSSYKEREVKNFMKIIGAKLIYES